MIINKDSQFFVHMLKDDARTGYKKGKVLTPKGVYWHKKNIILVGDVNESYPARLSLPADSVEVEVLNASDVEKKICKDCGEEYLPKRGECWNCEFDKEMQFETP